MRFPRLKTLALLPLLSSCALGAKYERYVFPALVEEEFSPIEKSGYSRKTSYDSLPYQGGSLSGALSDLYSHSPLEVIPSIGRQKLLVIPVDFSTYPSSSLPENSIASIEEAFFGSEKGNQYESVASFFDESSYHRFQLDGNVAKSWYRSPFTYEELLEKKSARQIKLALQSIYSSALSWYDASFPEDPSSNYAFLSPSGESVVPVYFIYSAPYLSEEESKKSRDSMMWAFTINDPAPISWSSFEMMHLRSDKTDAHTYIHETGHLLGLKDYYSKDLSIASPMGRADMMDCSLGDESSFSKLLLGWIRPYVVSSSAEVTLHQFEGSGETLLLAPNWNGNPFDEYLLLDFYTPTGLNRVDASMREGDALRLSKKYGIKITHVDARIALYSSMDSLTYNSLLTPSSVLGSSVLDFACSNNNVTSIGSYIDASQVLIQTLDGSSSSSKLITNFVASDVGKEVVEDGETLRLRDSLFQVGSSLPSDLSFHNQASIPFQIEISEITATYSKIKVTLS